MPISVSNVISSYIYSDSVVVLPFQSTATVPPQPKTTTTHPPPQITKSPPPPPPPHLPSSPLMLSTTSTVVQQPPPPPTPASLSPVTTLDDRSEGNQSSVSALPSSPAIRHSNATAIMSAGGNNVVHLTAGSVGNNNSFHTDYSHHNNSNGSVWLEVRSGQECSIISASNTTAPTISTNSSSASSDPCQTVDKRIPIYV